MRPALRSIVCCDGVRFFAGTSHTAVRYSHHDGSCRFSGFACHRAARSANRSSARPRRVSRCLRVSQSRREWTR